MTITLLNIFRKDYVLQAFDTILQRQEGPDKNV